MAISVLPSSVDCASITNDSIRRERDTVQFQLLMWPAGEPEYYRGNLESSINSPIDPGRALVSSCRIYEK